MTAGYTPDEPIAAIATALVPSALAIIRTSGAGCVELVSTLFSRPRALIEAQPSSLVYGWLCEPEADGKKGGRIDEVLIGVFRAPKSFTGEDMAEIYCHGGTAVVLRIYQVLLHTGFREARRGEFTFRAFVNGKTDLTRAEAVHEIIDAKTDEARSHAAERLSGALYRELLSIKQRLMQALASVEAEIEYPEDEETIADAFDPSGLRDIERELSRMCASWASEKLYQDGARIILCGKTNAGKSSLFNTLLKEERAIVSDIHGTTRDWLESGISFGGLPARLFDTAGLRETDDSIEQAGVKRTEALAGEADLMLYVIDTQAGISEEDSAFLTQFAVLYPELPVLLVCNKIDLAAAEQKDRPAELCVNGKTFAAVYVSAKSAAGIDALTTQVRVLLGARESTEREHPGLGSRRQCKAAGEALDSVTHAIQIAEDRSLPLDAVAQDIEDALDALGEITGTVVPDDILDIVFSQFCLGK